MDLGLKGKAALVAGGSRGLGRAIAEELSAEGASVALCGRDRQVAEETAEKIRKSTGGRVLGIQADVSKREDVARFVDAARRELGRVDILVTNAGGPPAGTFESHPREDWEAALALTLHSALELTRTVLPEMKERGWGRILNVTSVAVKQPIDDLILSNSIRAAVTGFARTLANEVAAHGITVNNLLPGYTRTARLEGLAQRLAEAEGTTPEAVVGRWEKEIPMGRLAEPRELAALAAFLASERAGYITGASIAVDGGWIRALL